MDNRRFVTFLVFFFAFTYLYNAIIVPKFFPRPVKPAAVEPEGVLDGNLADDNEADESAEEPPDGAEVAAESDAPEAAAKPASHPQKTITLGSLEPDSGYFLQAEISSVGAAIESVQITDPKFKELDDRNKQVTVVGTTTADDRTFSTAISGIDDQLKKHGQSLETASWEVVSSDQSQATFAYEAPDGKLRVEKQYRLSKVDVNKKDMSEEFETNAAGYTVEMELTIQNLSDEPSTVEFELQGPVGVVLENKAHTRKYRDIKLEFLGEDDDVTLSANDVVDLYETTLAEARSQGVSPNTRELRQLVRQKEPWTGAIRYAGVDVQFFAALMAPLDGRDEAQRMANKWIERTYPILVVKDDSNTNESDISFRVVSTPIELQAKGEKDSATRNFAFFVGPKRSDLLDPPPMEAKRVLDIDTGFFNTISLGLVGLLVRLMQFLLSTFHGLGLPYGLAIICLTALVRGCMFPISRKQAISAAKMKELQPKIKELQLKYPDDKQKVAQGQMELWRKHNINPLSGCMPLLFQMPIFIGLYSCLNTAVDLRMSKFLWIDNLAAPDALFEFPFAMPAIVGPHINVLPLVTVVLFLVQQKLFMPPPADEQAEMTQKMMNMMTFMFGAMFWHQPAGLCLYFICSSLWGIAERKLLGKASVSLGDDDQPSVTVKDPTSDTKKNGNKKNGNSGRQSSSKNAPPQAEKKQGFFAKLMEAAEEAQKQAEQKRDKDGKKTGGKRKGR
ncbi:membrane protein insertase YidC [Fuerstiella marisgermanici]|uniref:Membrane protein insertase YidC n=1 Tax=Fuerstiella marisgermanici TaxID=1891926 RepID=A0A1P8WIY9_9PLAN|nr:membrane protein insertase YidC [Fuerstiella marisgermanici]APZ94013.1 Oxa1Ec [Fuerstiella marisgermanici]